MKELGNQREEKGDEKHAQAEEQMGGNAGGGSSAYHQCYEYAHDHQDHQRRREVRETLLMSVVFTYCNKESRWVQ